MKTLMSVTVRPVIEIVTDNRYLEAGLRAVLDEMGEHESMRPDGEPPLKIVLIDAGRLGAYRAAQAWPSLAKQIRRANRYAFVSFTEACFDEVPHLPVHGSLSAVRAGLARLITTLTVSPPVRRPTLFDRLSATERKVMHCLLYEYSVEEIHRLLQRNKKYIYNARKQLMKKYNLGSHKALHDMLRVFAFIRGVNASLPGRSASRDAQKLVSVKKLL